MWYDITVENKDLMESEVPSSARIGSGSSIDPPNDFQKKKPLTTILLVILVIIVLVVIGFLLLSIRGMKRIVTTFYQTPSPLPAFSPTPEPKAVLKREDWSFEVLNGSGARGLAKKISDQLRQSGYNVVKTGNAGKDNYPKTQILVSKDFLDRVDLVIADLKDIIKIASVAGELKEGTASGRIIIGKDSTSN